MHSLGCWDLDAHRPILNALASRGRDQICSKDDCLGERLLAEVGPVAERSHVITLDGLEVLDAYASSDDAIDDDVDFLNVLFVAS